VADQDPAQQQDPAAQQQGSANDGKDSTGGTTSPTDGFKAPATQEELNRIIADRVARVEGKYKDVADLRKKATEYDKLVAANQTEQEKILARAEAAEKRAADLEAAEQNRQAAAEAAAQVAAWKTKIAEDTGVPASALRGNTQEELRDHAKEIKALLPDPGARRGGYVPAEGRGTGSGGGTDLAAQFTAALNKARGL
jgi:hypothetical protein